MPPREHAKLSAFEKQYWDIKKENMDMVLMFKKGKFYELYEMDADIGHRELDLKVTDRVNMRMVGVPEKSFELWASKLIAKGYKVGRVEQMESNKAKMERSSSKTTVCERKLCQVLTMGSITDPDMLPSFEANHMLSLKCGPSNAFGICVVDCAAGVFRLGAFPDDANFMQLNTFLQELRPREIVVEKGNLTANCLRVLKNAPHAPMITSLQQGKEFWNGIATASELRSDRYFGDDKKSWPAVVLEMESSSPEAMSALGGCLSYLRQLRIDEDLVQLKKFVVYDPKQLQRHMVLDGATIANLDILANGPGGDEEGSLVQLMDHCRSPFGKRLFRWWICHPLFRKEEIEYRVDSIEQLMSSRDLASKLCSMLKKLPDLERLLTRVHQNARQKEDVYMVDNADPPKLQQFVQMLDAFREAQLCLSGVQNAAENLPDGRVKELLTMGETIIFTARLHRCGCWVCFRRISLVANFSNCRARISQPGGSSWILR